MDVYVMEIGTISYSLNGIAEFLTSKGYALMMETAYRNWCSSASFRGENINHQTKACDYFIAHFEDENGHKWEIASYKYTSKNHINWRFIRHIVFDEIMIAKSATPFADFKKLIKWGAIKPNNTTTPTTLGANFEELVDYGVISRDNTTLEKLLRKGPVSLDEIAIWCSP